MAAVKFLKGSEEYQMFVDYWALVQRHYEVSDSDDYWSNALTDIEKFNEKYSNYPLAHKLALAYVEELDERGKNGREKARKHQSQEDSSASA